MASEIRVNKIINRSGLSTVTFSDTGAIVSGIVTANSFSGNVTGNVTGSGANLTSLPAANLTGTLPAISGANLTSLPAQVTINNASGNRVITSDGGTTLNGEANFSYDGTRCLIGTNTAAPYANRNLTVAQGSSGNTTVAIEVRSPTNGDGRLIFTDSTSANSGAYKGQIRYDQTNDFMSFNTNGDNERVRIDSSGRFAIGTSVPSDLMTSGSLDIQGNNTNAYLEMGNPLSGYASGKYPTFRIKTVDSNKSAQLESMYGGDNVLYKHIELSARHTSFHDGYSGETEIARFMQNGLTFNGDTAAANALDDYEEGTFTPNYDAGGGVTFTYSQQYGYYTKVGDTVFFSLYIQGYASTITGGNDNNGVALQGLPFTIKNLTRYYPAFTIGRTYKWDIDSDKRIYSYGTPNTTTGRFIIESDDNTGSIAVASQLNANTTELFLNGHYKV